MQCAALSYWHPILVANPADRVPWCSRVEVYVLHMGADLVGPQHATPATRAARAVPIPVPTLSRRSTGQSSRHLRRARSTAGLDQDADTRIRVRVRAAMDAPPRDCGFAPQ